MPGSETDLACEGGFRFPRALSGRHTVATAPRPGVPHNVWLWRPHAAGRSDQPSVSPAASGTNSDPG